MDSFLIGVIILGFISMPALGYPMWLNIKNVLHPLHSLKKLGTVARDACTSLTVVDLCVDQIPPSSDQSNV